MTRAVCAKSVVGECFVLLAMLAVPCMAQSPFESDAFKDLQLQHGDIEGDFLKGDVKYLGTPQGQARMRITLQAGEVFDVASDVVDWVSAAQTLTMSGKSSIRSKTLEVESPTIIYEVKAGLIQFPKAFSIVRTEKNRRHHLKGDSGWIKLVDGKLTTYRAVNARVTVQSVTPETTLPAGRRLAE